MPGRNVKYQVRWSSGSGVAVVMGRACNSVKRSA